MDTPDLWSTADVLALVADARIGMVIFNDHGYCVFHTPVAKAVLPDVNITLNKFLAEMQINEPVEQLLHQDGARFYMRRPGDSTVWRGYLQRRRTAGATLLLLEDVTEDYPRERLQQVLLEQVEKTPAGIGIAGEDHCGLYINPAMRRIFRLSEEDDYSAFRVEDVQPDGIGGMPVGDALRRAEHHGPYYADARLTDVEGEHGIEVSQMLMAHRDPLDNSLLYSTIVRDVTEQRRLREELADARAQLEYLLEERTRELVRSTEQAQYSQQLWRSLVDHNLDLVLFTNQHGEILFANQGFLHEGGVNLVGQNLFDFVVTGDRARVDRAYSALMRGADAHCSEEMTLGFAEDRKHYCFALVNRVQQLDGSHAATWVIADITAEREIRQQMALNEQMAATGRMAARVAHEINNPLAAIKSSMALVKMDISPDSEAAEYITLMESELERVSNIIRQMYGLYRPEQIPARCMPLDSIIRECCVLLQTDARAKGLELECDFRQPVSAVVAEAGLRQVLYNVILNAMDASPEHETVLITLDCDEHTAHICVRDKGQGLDADVAKRLFEPFFTTKETYSGMGLGLGLPVSLSLIRDMGGDLALVPAEGGGTECRVTLPVAWPSNS